MFTAVSFYIPPLFSSQMLHLENEQVVKFTAERSARIFLKGIRDDVHLVKYVSIEVSGANTLYARSASSPGRPVHSDVNSTYPGSILAMQQICADIKSISNQCIYM